MRFVGINDFSGWILNVANAASELHPNPKQNSKIQSETCCELTPRHKHSSVKLHLSAKCFNQKGAHHSSPFFSQRGLVLMVSLFLLFLLSLVAVSGVTVSRLGVYASQSFVDDFIARSAAFAALDNALADISRFRPNHFSGQGTGGKYLVHSFDRNLQALSAWQSVNCLPINLTPEAAVESPCVMVETLDSSDFSAEAVYRVSAIGIGSAPQTHVVLQGWVYQYRQSNDEATLVTELRGFKVL